MIKTPATKKLWDRERVLNSWSLQIYYLTVSSLSSPGDQDGLELTALHLAQLVECWSLVTTLAYLPSLSVCQCYFFVYACLTYKAK